MNMEDCELCLNRLEDKCLECQTSKEDQKDGQMDPWTGTSCQVVLTKCQHLFHLYCLEEYKVKKESCPICKIQIEILAIENYIRIVELLPLFLLGLDEESTRAKIEEELRMAQNYIDDRYWEESEREWRKEPYREYLVILLQEIHLAIRQMKQPTRNRVLNKLKEILLKDLTIKEEVETLANKIKGEFDDGSKKTISFIKNIIKQQLSKFVFKLDNVTVKIALDLKKGETVDLYWECNSDVQCAERYGREMEEMYDEYMEYVTSRCESLDFSIDSFVRNAKIITEEQRKRVKKIYLHRVFLEERCSGFERSLNSFKSLFPNAKVLSWEDEEQEREQERKEQDE